MILRLRYRLLLETGLVLLFIPALAFVLISYDFFDQLYEFTRAHEDWELDEIICAGIAVLFIGTLLAIRQVYLLARALQKLQDTREELAHHLAVKHRNERLLALGELSSGLAHEINNALQPVLGLSEIAQRRLKGKDEKLYGYMVTLEESARHARKIVSNVLSFSRNHDIQVAPMDARQIFRDAISFGASLLPSSVQVRYVSENLSSEHITAVIDCDKTGLMQVFANLFKNASDAMDEKGIIWLSFETRVLSYEESLQLNFPQEEFVIVQISDEGSGIDPKILPTVFNPFFTTKGEGEGTGLGLSTAFGIMKQHNGTMTVKNIPDAGACFTLYFPVVSGDAGPVHKEDNDHEDT